MKLSSIINFASVATLAAASPIGFASGDATSTAAIQSDGGSVVQPSQFQLVQWTEVRRAKLREAFWLLEHANADYNGHRGKAMVHVKKAGEFLGMDLHGKGYDGAHVQEKSDARLRHARDLLRDVAAESGGKELERIRLAIRELDLALTVR
jgi:hypothetical protein